MKISKIDCLFEHDAVEPMPVEDSPRTSFQEESYDSSPDGNILFEKHSDCYLSKTFYCFCQAALSATMTTYC